MKLRSKILSFAALLFSLSACTQKGFEATEESSSRIQSAPTATPSTTPPSLTLTPSPTPTPTPSPTPTATPTVTPTPSPTSQPGACEATGTGKCYFIDAVNGNDLNPGTHAQPWASFKKIWTGYPIANPVTLKPGDVVYVRKGIYSTLYNSTPVSNCKSVALCLIQVKGTAANRIVIKAFPGEKPVIGTGKTGMGIYTYLVDYLTIDGFEIQNTYGPGIDLHTSVNVKILNMDIHDIDGVCNNNISGFRSNGDTDIELAYSNFTDNFDRTGGGGCSPENSAHVTIFGAAAGDIHIHHNNFSQTPTATGATGGCVRNKHTSPNPNTTLQVYNNIFNNCAYYPFTTDTFNSHFHHNIIIGGGTVSVKNNGGSTNFINDVFEYNTFVNVARSFSVYIHTYSGSIGSSLKASDYSVKNIVFRNNIVYETRSTNDIFNNRSTMIFSTYGSDFELGLLRPELHIDRNCYYNASSGGSPYFNWFGCNSASCGTVPGATYLQGGGYGLSGWQSQGFDINSVNSDPQFIDLANGNFKPGNSSPCKSMGAL
jgi:hypothetical protein